MTSPDEVPAGMTADLFVLPVQVALERFLDHLADMSLDQLEVMAAGFRVSVALVMEGGDLDSAGAFDSLAELVEAIGAARTAFEEENR